MKNITKNHILKVISLIFDKQPPVMFLASGIMVPLVGIGLLTAIVALAPTLKIVIAIVGGMFFALAFLRLFGF